MRCSAINEKGEQCPWDAVGSHGWCRKHNAMRRISVKAVLRRWLGTCGFAFLTLCLIQLFTPLQRPGAAAGVVLVTSLLIASWQEWVLLNRRSK